MAAFELRKGDENQVAEASVQGFDNEVHNQRRLREECIIAFKVYDSCRQQDCLTAAEIGPARAAEHICIGGEHMKEGDIIDPPSNDGRCKTQLLRGYHKLIKPLEFKHNKKQSKQRSKEIRNRHSVPYTLKPKDKRQYYVTGYQKYNLTRQA